MCVGPPPSSFSPAHVHAHAHAPTPTHHHHQHCYFFAPQRYSVFAHKKISTSNSSVGEIRLKENCERLMTQLESDIKKLSIPGPISVKDE